MQLGYIEVFLEAITIASKCNEVLRKRFLETDTVGLIPTGGYIGNVRYNKKALMWHVYREKMDGYEILGDRNGCESRLPQIPHLSVDGFCQDTRKAYEVFGYYWHGNTWLTFRDVTTIYRNI
jgi:hypothetical protein